MSAKGMGKFYAHVAQTAQANDADFVALSHLPVPQW
jgi:hypothetical protein